MFTVSRIRLVLVSFPSTSGIEANLKKKKNVVMELKISSKMKVYKCVGGRIQLVVIKNGISSVFVCCYNNLEGVTLVENKILD